MSTFKNKNTIMRTMIVKLLSLLKVVIYKLTRWAH